MYVKIICSKSKVGRFLRHSVYTVRCIVDRLTSDGSTVNLCAIDLSKAFNKVSHYELYVKLMKRHFAVKVLHLIENT